MLKIKKYTPVVLFANYKYFFLRGWPYFSILQAIMIFILGFNVFYTTFTKLGIPMPLLYVGVIVSVVSVPVFIGVLDYRHVVSVENQRQWETTDVAMKLCRQVEEMHKDMIRLRKEEDDHR